MKAAVRLERDFFTDDVLDVAPLLPGKFLCVGKHAGAVGRHMITEVEAYRGEEDLACHARKGRTRRTEIMYHRGGLVYMYLIYGMYWMLNIVTSVEDSPQAVLIRGVVGFDGPGKLTRHLNIDGTFYGDDISVSERIWIEDGDCKVNIEKGRRIGIDYAGSFWRNIEWRYYVR